VAELNVERLAGAALPVSTCRDPKLEYVRAHNPSARLLPLLEALARGEPARIVLDMATGGQLRIDVKPC
jgi:hypothetical protein